MKHPVFSFSALFIPFFIDFSHFSDQAAYFLLFIALFDFAVTFLLFYSFNVFFSLRHASLPLHLPGLPFSLFLRAILRFSQFSTLFILFLCFFHLFCHSSAPSPLSLLLSPVFFAFSSIPYCICLFSAVFFLFSAHFYLFSIFCLFRRFLPSFRHFSVFPPFFRFYLCHSSRLVFSRFTPLKMFHVKHRFSRFPVFSGQ